MQHLLLFQLGVKRIAETVAHQVEGQNGDHDGKTGEDGQIAVVLIDGEDATVKEVKKVSDGIILIAHNLLGIDKVNSLVTGSITAKGKAALEIVP